MSNGQILTALVVENEDLSRILEAGGFVTANCPFNSKMKPLVRAADVIVMTRPKHSDWAPWLSEYAPILGGGYYAHDFTLELPDLLYRREIPTRFGGGKGLLGFFNGTSFCQPITGVGGPSLAHDKAAEKLLFPLTDDLRDACFSGFVLVQYSTIREEAFLSSLDISGHAWSAATRLTPVPDVIRSWLLVRDKLEQLPGFEQKKTIFGRRYWSVG